MPFHSELFQKIKRNIPLPKDDFMQQQEAQMNMEQAQKFL